MRKTLATAAAVSVTALAFAATDVSSTPTAAEATGSATTSAAVAADSASVPAVVHSTTPIKHVVIIYQENHSFDDTLGAFCRQVKRRDSCDGKIGPATLANGVRAANTVQPDIVPFVLHTVSAQLLAMQNKWNRLEGCHAPTYNCVTHVPTRRIPNLVALGQKYAVSDRTFASDPYASFGMHVAVTAGTVDGFIGRNPKKSITGAPRGSGWGCSSNLDAAWAPSVGADFINVPSCIPSRFGNGPYRRSPVAYAPTIMERMEQRGLGWHIYQGSREEAPVDDLWSVCAYFFWCDAHRFTTNFDSSTADFVTQARRGELEPLSLLMPVADNSQHNRRSMTIGDNYIGRVVRAAMHGSDWRSTAIFITYDDCGCFYDHVSPPEGLGLRNPMVIVSPYAKRGYTDRRVAVQPYSMLTFLQHNFRLAPLTPEVSRAYDYMRAFNFNLDPRSGIPMVRTPISAEERKVLASLPSIENDPT